MPARVTTEPSFAELVERLQQDDRAAVGLLIERYGSALRRAIERALWDRRLASTGATSVPDPVGPESSDVFQTVLLLFLIRLRRHRDGSGATLHFETPAHLVAYLKAIAEHELGRRRASGIIRAEAGFVPSRAIEPASSDPTPSQYLLTREILERDQAVLAEVMRRLSTDETAIWDLVPQELSWPEIARRLEGTRSAEAIRKTFTRAVRRIADELKLGGLDHD